MVTEAGRNRVPDSSVYAETNVALFDGFGAVRWIPIQNMGAAFEAGERSHAPGHTAGAAVDIFPVRYGLADSPGVVCSEC